MRVMILGGAGRTGSFLAAHLFAAYHQVSVLVRDPADLSSLRRLGRLVRGTAAPGVEPVAGDLLGGRERLVEAFTGYDAIINAAGSGDLAVSEPSVDREGAIAAIEAAQRAGVDRFIQLSMAFADRPQAGPDVLRPLLAAKHDSDAALTGSGMDWTVIRPGPLSDGVLTGCVTAGLRLTEPLPLPREDLASVAAVCLSLDWTVGLAFDVAGGTIPILPALVPLAGPPADA